MRVLGLPVFRPQRAFGRRVFAPGVFALTATAPTLFALVATAASPAPAHAQEVQWQRELRGDIRNVLRNHYLRELSSDSRSIDCLAERGDNCFGGDHEDWFCRRVFDCRTPAVRVQFVMELIGAVGDRPDDPSLVAQAVYGLARVGRTRNAIEQARRCRAAGWWCDLVMGLALHRAGRSADAGNRYRSALEGADPELACRLTDIRELLDGSDGASYRRLPCPGPERSQFEDRFWWLSDPLLSRPGNDRWTEHLTRRFELLLHERLRRAVYNRRTLPAYHIDVTRRGHPDSWKPRGRDLETWKSENGARYRFTPASLVEDGIEALDYELEASRWDEGFTPTEYGTVFEVPGQVARLMDGDSPVLAVSADLDAIPFGSPVTRFIASGGPNGFFVQHRIPAADMGPSFAANVEAVPLLAAIEAYGPGGAVARMRQGVMPLEAGGLVLSDPLLVNPLLPDLPESREEAVAEMLPQTRIGSANEMIAYWEVYGLEEGQTMQVSLALEREGAGMLTRVLRTLGGRPADPAPSVTWTEPASGSTHPMALGVDVEALEDGNYDLKIQITGPDGSVANTVRRFAIGGR